MFRVVCTMCRSPSKTFQSRLATMPRHSWQHGQCLDWHIGTATYCMTAGRTSSTACCSFSVPNFLLKSLWWYVCRFAVIIAVSRSKILAVLFAHSYWWWKSGMSWRSCTVDNVLYHQSYCWCSGRGLSGSERSHIVDPRRNSEPAAVNTLQNDLKHVSFITLLKLVIIRFWQSHNYSLLPAFV